jgi:hypothetical protein
MIAATCPSLWRRAACWAFRGDHVCRVARSPPHQRCGGHTGVVVGAPAPGQRCGLRNAGAAHVSGAARPPMRDHPNDRHPTGVMIVVSAHEAARYDWICAYLVIKVH